MEIRHHRLTDKAYPLLEESAQTELKINQFSLTMTGVVPDISTDAQYHDVSWRVENPTGILEPTYYDGVKIMSQNTIRVLALPTRGVHFDKEKGENFVYTVDEDSRLARRTVVCGLKGDSLTEIVSGLERGEPVVIADSSKCVAGMKVGASEYEF